MGHLSVNFPQLGGREQDASCHRKCRPKTDTAIRSSDQMAKYHRVIPYVQSAISANAIMYMIVNQGCFIFFLSYHFIKTDQIAHNSVTPTPCYGWVDQYPSIILRATHRCY